jgi:cell wall-associated NlpC family hydrolase
MQAASLALAQIGRPYRFGGEDPSGFDCSGLILYVYGLLDVPMPRTVSEQSRMGFSVTAAEVQPGDLLFFHIDGSRVSHVGIYAGGDVFVHAPRTGQEVEQESLTNGWWRDRLVSVRRVLGGN